MTQKETVLKMLKEQGVRGVHSWDFYQANIPRFAAWINELRDEGQPIFDRREGKGKRYVYGRPLTIVEEVEPQDDGLFSMEEARPKPRSAFTDPEAA